MTALKAEIAMNFKIENTNIELQNTLPNEIDQVCELEKQPSNAEFITPYDRDRHLQVIDSKDEEHLSIRHKETNEVIGFIILAGLQNPNLSLELRRIIVQQKEKGFGRQCLGLIKAYCFKGLQFHRLWLDVFEDNHRAIYLYQSEGFKEEGRLRDVIKLNEKYKSLLILSILENEYL